MSEQRYRILKNGLGEFKVQEFRVVMYNNEVADSYVWCDCVRIGERGIATFQQIEDARRFIARIKKEKEEIKLAQQWEVIEY